MKNIFSIVVTSYLVIQLLALQSCKKYLDKKPDSRLTVPTSLTDLQALLDASTNMNIRQSPSFGEASTDDYFLPDAAYAAFSVDFASIYTWNRVDYRYGNDWSKCYLPVYNSNYCLEQVEQTPINSANKEQWENVKGSALFFRSYNYLNLIWVYAKSYDAATAATDLGIVLRAGSNFNVPSVRSSVKDCYDRIVRDTKEAATLLPDNPFHVMRPSKAAAYGLLARAYLSMRNYDSAFKYADLCLQIKSALIDFNGDPDINGSISANIPFKRFNKETIFYVEMNTSFFIQSPTEARIDTGLFSMYLSDDLRKTAYFKPISGYHQFKGSYNANPTQYFTGIATDEIYLIRAEAHARMGRITEAMNDLNTLMRKRWRNSVPYPTITATDQADAIKKILDERRKELYMRGVRWIDIKRLNKEGRNIVLQRRIAGQNYYLQPNANYFALPLPIDIIEQTGIPQN